MEVAEPGRPSAVARTTRSRWKVAVAAALPILTVFVWLCLVYGWEAWGLSAPWLNSDEFERAQLSRAIATTGHEASRTVPRAFGSLSAYLVAPAWWIHDTSRAYGAAKAIGVATMTAVVFPVYLLARTLVSQRWALFAAAGAAMIPALAYSSMLLIEPLAYPWAALCFYLLARALGTRRLAWIAGAVAACLVAPLIRAQLDVLVAGAVAAAVLFWFIGEGGRRLRRNWSRWDWVGFVALAICAAVGVNAAASHRSGVWAAVTQNELGRMFKDAVWAAGALTIGVGVLPTIAALTVLPGFRRDEWSRERRAYTALTVAMVSTFVAYVAGKSAYVSTLGVNDLSERNLIYVAPLLFVGTALMLERRRPALIPLLAATALVLLLVTVTPYHVDIPVFFDAPGLAVLPALGLTTTGATVLLVVLALGSAALLLFLRFASARVAVPVAAVAAGGILAWSAFGEISFTRESHKVASAQLDNMPRPLDWVDRAVPGGAQVTYLGQSIDDPFDVLQLEFWNRKLQHVWSTDGSAPGPGPTVVPQLTASDGRLEPGAGVEYLVADSGVTPAGAVLERKVHRGGRGSRIWTLIHVAPPLRLRQSIEGVYPDGWGKPITALDQFSVANDAPSVVKVHVFRTGAAQRYPATVRVTVGKLALAGDKPVMGRVVETKTIRVPDRLDHEFVFDAPPAPFRVETSVTPFPHERDPRIGDPRDLGANVEYSVTQSASGS
ncbi:MAG: hypothetical protein ACJ74I_13795 [Gaiellaceae bacterium]